MNDAGKENRWIWHDAESDPPDSDRYILLSFANADFYAIGRYEEDEEGGAYFDGDDDEPLTKIGLIVNGWWELPRKPGEER